MNNTIRYIISFLLYGNENAIDRVGYGKPAECNIPDVKTIQLKASAASPLNNRSSTWQQFISEVEAAVTTEKISDVFEHYDVVSIVCFFLSRAEELCDSQRDQHGRLIGKTSVLGKHNMLLIPVLDEYARYLLKQLDLPLPRVEYSKIYLTHDVDTITQYRHLRGLLGGIKRLELKNVVNSMLSRENDVAFTFRWLKQIDDTLPDAEQIYFLKANTHQLLHPLDRPQYSSNSCDAKAMKTIVQGENTSFGLHYSYASADKPELISKEKQIIKSNCYRAHYLRSTIDSYRALQAGDDFSMGYADSVGFRLATTRCTRWIDPLTLRVTNLTLHPLSVMDATLSSKQYMNLTEDEAYYTCQQVIDTVKRNNGELCLLWHNSNFYNTYHTNLYRQIINYISES
mgnify:FL=1